MNQEDLLVLLVVFVLGFVVSRMMSGRLVEGRRNYKLNGEACTDSTQCKPRTISVSEGIGCALGTFFGSSCHPAECYNGKCINSAKN